MRALLVAALLVLAGCAGAPAPGTPPGRPNPARSTTAPLSTPPATASSRATPPDRPEPLTRESAREFPVAYQTASTYNGLLEEATERVEVNIRDSNVTGTADVCRVLVEARWFTWTSDPSKNGSTETATPAHRDGPYDAVAYLVTDDRLVRDEGTHDSTPAPREQGRTVQCW
jgi:hypothetical protein